ncbi:prominin-like protein [Drosophila virilis]|uniref:Prominin-like protein n=1 Tax=Drosophila virilis TaxID=7244 RepID=B4M9S9_DROVI|nr:prominin-like protein [Drosophila virilis]XP_032293821.1 prominin-like protein [Drosophila virilis]EDW57955.2 uncharacterized protein Dvir_GJ18376 [Drosophila virilis]
MIHMARSSRKVSKTMCPKIRNRRKWRHMMKFIIKVIIFVVAINTTIPSVGTAEWDKDELGFGMLNDKEGLRHFEFTNFTKYESKPIYSVDPTYHSMYMSPIHELTHIMFGDDVDIPRGYIENANNSNALHLGNKVETNDWMDLLANNKLLIVWILLILFLIIIVPFVAVCYFCFCCCHCPNVCPPCAEGSHAAKRTFCSILMLLLILGILMGLLIAFLNEKLIHRGLQESIENMHRHADDTCAFLKDVCDHVNHLFTNNFEELETHLIASLNEADTHIFMDLTESSGLVALSEIELIFSSMPQALRLLKRAESYKNSLIFLMAQFRDGVRGMKRDITYLHTVWCDYYECNNFLRTNKIPKWGTKPCLHVDNLPNITHYVEAIEDIIEQEVVLAARNGIERYHKVNKMIEDVVNPQIPPLITKIGRVGITIKEQGEKVCDIINSIMSDIYFQNARITKSFGDFNDSYGPDRKIISVILFLLILAIIVILFVAFIFGCCIRRDNTGSKCLLLAIILIFFFLSLLLLVMLFYFLLGMIMYYGVCIPRTDEERRSLFRVIEPKANEQNPQGPSITRTCKENQTIFDVLLEYELFDLSNMKGEIARNISTVDAAAAISADLSNVKVLRDNDIIKINKAHTGNLSNYHSRLATEHLCTELTSSKLVEFKPKYYQWNRNFFFPLDKHDQHMKVRLWSTYPSLWKIGLDIDNIAAIEPNILKDMEKLKTRLIKIDKLITRNNNDFNNTIKPLLDSVARAEEFIRSRGSDYVNMLCNNLTSAVNEEINHYVNYVIDECNLHVGSCRPIAYMYQHSIDLVCERLVDPINGFWLGLLICALLFLPLLFVAHRLLCLYRVHSHVGAAGVMFLDRDGYNCPTCTGIPYKPPPVIVCDGGQNAYCPCADANNPDGNALKEKQA